ncbi:DUF2339 domain-containing protein [Brevifollis gellanilyticus]|uniref:DUF2339 domain-containing protein n=1 Tax=Brevifollis gellanilyticus TaxID=748831 RepID=A0A512M673_9BACT|nr:DUF2339 domain-containing protein [Brevifollis gellanilyticus]GEP41841.1 hypothetical protein BGE01nite_11320 [Brevifollis gellanilyticus]
MEVLFILLAIGFIIAPIAALVIAQDAKSKVRSLETQLNQLRVMVTNQAETLLRLSSPSRTKPERDASVSSAPQTSWSPPQETAAAKAPEKSIEPEKPAATNLGELMAQASVDAAKPAAAVPPPLPVPAKFELEKFAPPPTLAPSKPVATPPPALPKINLEQFMGAKMFAWIGGLAMFLGILFFVKLSFERGWISPSMRIVIGYIIGLALMVVGVFTSRSRLHAVLGQTLCATGIVVAYGVTFAAHSLYHLAPLNSPTVTFLVMSLITVTVTAFILAVRMNAMVVAVLGMLGGFLTPPLCSTGQDQPFALFSYIALLDIGVLAVVRHKRWMYLTLLAAGGTLLMQAGWLIKFYKASGYAYGSATWVPIGVFLFFGLIFTLAVAWIRERDDEPHTTPDAALLVSAGALITAFFFLSSESISIRPLVLYSFVLGINALVMGIFWLKPRVAWAHPIVLGLTFLHLTLWTSANLTQELLTKTLGIYLAFGVLHTAFSVLWTRRGEKLVLPAGWSPLFALVLMMLPVLTLETVGLTLWPAVLLVDILVIVLAAISRAVLPLLASLVLTLIMAGIWLFHLPGGRDADIGPFLIIVGGFAMLFSGVGAWMERKMPKTEHVSLVPVSSAVLPFALLTMATQVIPVPNPSSMFGLALILALFLLGIVKVSGITQLALTALMCVGALEWVWHVGHFSAEKPTLPLLWYLGFYLLFVLFPFIFRAQFAETKLPWITSAASGLVAFGLVYRVVKLAWPNDFMGLVPAAFILAPALGLAYVIKQHSRDNPARMDQLAWFGGVALLFFTLIFPIQYEKQWITLGWALEGAALCWLFRRVPHPGLRATGTALLTASFVRLSLNLETLSYHVRGETMILNWQLYTYSIAALAMFAAARWLQAPNHRWGEVNLRGLFCTYGGILLFLLVNIEIADAFTEPGSSALVFKFSGNFARDMSYTIAWALFALILIILGLWKRAAPARYAGIGLLGITVLKLFLHDLARIDSVYRIGALIVVSLIALAASFLYQRFLGDEKGELAEEKAQGPEGEEK